MRRVLTLVLAVMVSGMVAGLVGAFVMNLAAQGQAAAPAGAQNFLTFSALLSLLALPTAAVIGLPAHTALSRAGRTRRAPYVLAGVMAGLIIGVVFSGFRADGWVALLVGMCAGAGGGLGFWLIARPDRLAKT
ncbi:MAG TPA: hypothetical protein VGR32_10920 [Brevundimonas sp.]|jgi:heme/copper-type cytochrome/quinol oxidase subunit 3|uniref:hypothetical protein n=1 Tax=Brevundimonas sp. TaxID=1871086 RepID=UPI002DF11ECE|nr:hypothetical protein [Brevundimonas sp.]